jgi:hypothetical protein
LFCSKRGGFGLRILLAVLAAAGPVVLSEVIVRFYFGVDLLHFVPAFSDEVDYWHQALTFAHVGLSGGYYGVGPNEPVAAAGFVHFGDHGALYPVITGAFGWVFGWHLYSSVLFNIAVLGLATIFYALFAKLGVLRLILLALVLTSFWPAVDFLASAMEETLHQAIAVVVAAVLARMLVGDSESSRRMALWAIPLVVISSLIRPAWALTVAPLIWLGLRPRTKSARLGAIVAFVAACVLAEAGFSWLAAPYPGHPFAVGFENVPSVVSFAQGIWHNVRFLLSWRAPSALELIQNIELLGLLTAYIVAFLLQVRRARQSKSSGPRPGQVVPLQLWILGSILLAAVLTYDLRLYAGYRIFAPFILMSLLITIAVSRRPWAAISVAAVNLALSGLVVTQLASIQTRHFVYDSNRLMNLQRAFNQVMPYVPGAPARCNTLLTNRIDDSDFTAVPAGIGITYNLGTDALPPVIHSHYLLLDDAGIRMLGARPGFAPVSTTAAGVVYENRAIICPGGS